MIATITFPLSARTAVPGTDFLADQLLSVAPRITRYDTGFGLGGVALFFLSRYRLHGNSTDLDTARRLTWQCIEAITNADRTGGTSLIEYCEIAQLLRLNAESLMLEEIADELLPVLDGLIERRMSACFTAGLLDPYTGGFNAALYLLINLKDARHLRAEWLRYLPTESTLAERTSAGDYAFPSGISHGLAFYAYFVARYLERYPHDEAFVALGETYLKELLARRQSADEHGCFYNDGGQKGAGRLSLAYGDAGILFAGFRLAEALWDTVAREEILDCLEVTATRRTLETTGITTNGLLYGRAGAWLFFHRLAGLARRPIFRQAAGYWRNEALKNASEEEEIAPFDHYDYGAMKTVSLFEGSLGFPLVTQAIATDATSLYNLFYLN